MIKDITAGNMLSKTDELMVTMSRRINDPLLNGDADHGSAVVTNNEPCELGSHGKKPDDCCEYHNDEHRPDYLNEIPTAHTQAFNEICADGTLQGECKYQKTCQQGLEKESSQTDNAEERKWWRGDVKGMVDE
ncbi:hypothetical protein Bpfe_007445 [Biomphalaria pfeifferi]|uniref:Uncharacterized protein n=1 Tax=Biomphalaria pfeifferi TaxID=112525 RepID=A0AAD8C0M3_BIOPF|nr:hypothetical protein Bpfe_007445 [Biomphalaria pfeifferi]